jgi:hypothetical protein
MITKDTLFCDHLLFSKVISVNKMFHLEPSPRSFEDNVTLIEYLLIFFSVSRLHRDSDKTVLEPRDRLQDPCADDFRTKEARCHRVYFNFRIVPRFGHS